VHNDRSRPGVNFMGRGGLLQLKLALHNFVRPVLQ
jgi:hypothetical protein